MDSLGSLSAFVQAAETRSFVAAGRQLGVSASAVGKSIARLETRLGVRLFHRSTRSITLTPEGQLFLERCRRIVCEIEAAEAELSDTLTAPRGRLRVSIPLITPVFMPIIAGFMRAYPEIELDIDSSDRLVDVIEEGYDVVVRTGEVGDSRLMTRILGGFSKVVAASPDYLLRHGTPQRPEDLMDHNCLLHRFPSTGKLETWPLWADGKPLEMDLPARFVSSSLDPKICLAEQGFGLICVPELVIRRQLETGVLQSVLADHVRFAGTFRALWPSSRHPSLKLRAFVDFVAANLSPPARAPAP